MKVTRMTIEGAKGEANITRRDGMATREKRPARLPNGTRVHVRSDHFAEQFDGVVTKGEFDGGWLYRVKPTGGTAPAVARNKEGEYWFWDFEVTPLGRKKRPAGHGTPAVPG